MLVRFKGNKPVWDFATTFKIIVDDFLLRYLATDVITLELNMVISIRIIRIYWWIVRHIPLLFWLKYACCFHFSIQVSFSPSPYLHSSLPFTLRFHILSFSFSPIFPSLLLPLRLFSSALSNALTSLSFSNIFLFHHSFHFIIIILFLSFTLFKACQGDFTMLARCGIPLGALLRSKPVIKILNQPLISVRTGTYAVSYTEIEAVIAQHCHNKYCMI